MATATLLVEGVNRELPEWVLVDFIERVGGSKVVGVRNSPRGYTLVTMPDEDAAQVIIYSWLQGHRLCDKPLRIRFAGQVNSNSHQSLIGETGGDDDLGFAFVGGITAYGLRTTTDYIRLHIKEYGRGDFEDLAQQVSRMEIKAEEGEWRKFGGTCC